MIFNSIPFLVFALIFFLVWKMVKDVKIQKWIWICLMSFVFYAWWDWRFLFLLIGTGSIDYWCGLQISKGFKAKFFLYLSVISNLASLLVFKYSLFIADVIDSSLLSLNIQSNLHDSIPEFTIILPLGISFYTFNSLSYTIDLYKGKAKKAESCLHFMAFISFFPHLVAGPIIRAKDILGQLSKHRIVNDVEKLNAIKTCIWGFFQKMVLADNLAVLVNAQFSNINTQTDTLQWWLVMIAFAFQIYFDFNGYSTIARGLAKLCGIHFKLNFNHPYKASSFGEFWQRWHISLSSFFRDYVYIPLGGNRKSKFRTELNRWITMLLSGIWHGAGYTFFLWGALHAAFLSIESIFNLRKNMPKVIMAPLVFIGVTLAWVLFRASSLTDALQVYGHLFSFENSSSLIDLFKNNGVIWLMIAVSIEFVKKSKLPQFLLSNWVFQALFWTSMVIATILLRGPEQQFIYFQF